MKRNFPMLSKQVTRGCVYLHTNGVHEFLVEGLQKSLFIKAVDWNSRGQGCIREVQHYLASKYGGAPESYQAHQHSQDTYRIQLPPGLPREGVISEGQQWCHDSGWLMHPWDINRKAYTAETVQGTH